jgi:hypothetical protein
MEFNKIKKNEHEHTWIEKCSRNFLRFHCMFPDCEYSERNFSSGLKLQEVLDFVRQDGFKAGRSVDICDVFGCKNKAVASVCEEHTFQAGQESRFTKEEIDEAARIHNDHLEQARQDFADEEIKFILEFTAKNKQEQNYKVRLLEALKNRGDQS